MQQSEFAVPLSFELDLTSFTQLLPFLEGATPVAILGASAMASSVRRFFTSLKATLEEDIDSPVLVAKRTDLTSESDGSRGTDCGMGGEGMFVLFSRRLGNLVAVVLDIGVSGQRLEHEFAKEYGVEMTSLALRQRFRIHGQKVLKAALKSEQVVDLKKISGGKAVFEA